MMKKLVLSYFFAFGLLNGVCLGMHNGSARSLTTADLLDRQILAQIVTKCVDKSSGKVFTRCLLKSISHEEDDIAVKRVIAMFKAISLDWRRAGYNGVGGRDYYVSGAFDGKFGPFDLKDFKYEPHLSTTYSNDAIGQSDEFNM